MRHEVGVDETAMNVLEAGCSVDEPLAIVPELWTRARNAGQLKKNNQGRH